MLVAPAATVRAVLTDLQARIVAAVRDLPPGTVTTYGEVAAEAGAPRAARAVGRTLAQVDEDLPWWRVVTASGRLVPGCEDEHVRRLTAEGVEVADGHVVALRWPARSRSAGAR